MSVQYNQLEDRKGTIHNKITGKDYSSNADLAKDLAIQPHLIDWKQIKPPKAKAPSLFEPFKKLAEPLTKPFTNLFKKSDSKSTPINYDYKKTSAKNYGKPQQKGTILNQAVQSTSTPTSTPAPASQPKYENFVDVNGTIYNKATGVGYKTQEELSKDLGIASNKIDWTKIKSGQKPQAKDIWGPSQEGATQVDPKTGTKYTYKITSDQPKGSWHPETSTPIDPNLKNQSVSDYNSRAKLAKENGITGYVGTDPQNARLDEILKQGDESTDEYGNLVDVKGTIYDKTTGKGYKTPEELGKDLGKAPHEIDWKQIKPGEKPEDTQSEIEKINEEENQSQEEELAIIEEESTEDVDLSTSASLVERLLKILETKNEEKTPSMEQKFLDEKKALGVGELETSLTEIESEMQQLDADYMSAIEGEEGRKVSMTQVKRRQSAEGIQYNRAKRDLQVERDSIANQLNMKYGVVNSIMKYAGADYDNAQQDYQLKWNTAMQMTNLVKGMEDSAKSDDERKTDNARANAQIMFNLFKEGNISYGSLDEATKLDIKNTEIQAGLPVGFTGFIMETIDDPVVHFGSAFTNAAGDRIQPITTVDKATGNIAIKNVNLGQVGATGDSKGPSSYQEWTLAGGLEGTGKSYADFIATKSGETEAEKSQKARVGIAAYLNQNTGDDGYVSPDAFKTARSAWVSDGYSSEDFDKAYKNFANPTHYPDYSPDYY